MEDGTHRADAAEEAFCLDGLDSPNDLAPVTSVAQRMHVELTSNKWHGIKQTFEVIRNSYRTCIITADPKRLQIIAYDNKCQSPGFLLEVPTSNIEPYSCLSPISVSVSTAQISTMLRHVRKRETVMFFIDAQNQRCGLLSNSTTGHARKSEFSVSVVQLVYFDEPRCFSEGARPFVISTADFGRMLKEMRNVAKTVTVSSRPGEWIRFNTASVHSRSNDEWFGRINILPPIIKQDFSAQQFIRIIKLSSLNSSEIEMTIAAHEETNVLCVRVELPMLGRLSVYFSASLHAPPEAAGENPSRAKRPRP